MRQPLGRDVVIVEAARTPIGRGRPDVGYYADVHPNVLLGASYRALIERTGIDPAVVDEVIAGCVVQVGEQSQNIARNAWLQEGLPVSVPAVTVHQQCGSAQQAIGFAASQIADGTADVVIAGGVEHMGHLPMGADLAHPDEFGTPFPPALLDRYALVPQGLSAEMIAEQWQIPREELDALGVRSQELAARATEAGNFRAEIVPMTVDGQTHVSDQGIRAGTTLEVLAKLKPAFRPDGRVTAATSSQISDGAAAVLLMSREKAGELGLKPRARIVDQVSVGVDPVIMLTGPIPATEKLLRRNDLTVADIDRFEVNEAFAPVVLAWQRELQPEFDRVNVNGGALALGHPLGSSGARLITTLVHELERSDRELGLVTMCTAGGTGTGTLIQRI